MAERDDLRQRLEPLLAHDVDRLRQTSVPNSIWLDRLIDLLLSALRAEPSGATAEPPILCESGGCGKPATCFGVYECETDPLRFACDDCCGHGCEDGWCKPIAELATFARRWYGETQVFAERMEDGRIQHAQTCAELHELKERRAAPSARAAGGALAEVCEGLADCPLPDGDPIGDQPHIHTKDGHFEVKDWPSATYLAAGAPLPSAEWTREQVEAEAVALEGLAEHTVDPLASRLVKRARMLRAYAATLPAAPAAERQE